MSLLPSTRLSARRLLLSLIALILSFSACPASSAAAAVPKRIGILLWHDTPHDEAAMAGLFDGLRLAGLDHALLVRRARGKRKVALTILEEFKRLPVQAVVAISTRGALLAQQQLGDIPLFYTAITNPVASGLADDWQRPGHNATGSSNWIPAGKLLAFFKEVLPGLTRLGVIYDPSNPVPVAEVEEVRKAAPKLGIQLVSRTIADLTEAEEAIAAVAAQGVNGFWIPRDKLLYSNMELISPILLRHRLPCVSSTREALTADGSVALAAMLADYRKLGRMLLPSIVAVLEQGVDPGTIPIALPDRYRLIINLNAAKLVGFRFPYRFAADADEIIHGYAGQQIEISGSEDCQRLLRRLAAALEEELEGGSIVVPDGIGSTGGLRQLLAGKTDLARISRPLTEEEQAQGIVAVPFALTPVVFVVHADTAGIANLSQRQIAAIYTGAITDWSQVGGRPGPIYPVTRNASDPSLRILVRRLAGFPEQSPVAKVVYSTGKTAAILQRFANTIGFLPLAMLPNDERLIVLRIDGIMPSPAAVQSGAYPLAIPNAIAYRGRLSGLARRFVAFLRSEPARRLILANGAAPITD